MRKFFLLGILGGTLVLFAGCTASLFVPVTYGSAQICSGSPGIYGELYVDGRYAGYLEPNRCRVADGLLLGEYHVARVYHPWGGVYSREFYLSFSGQVVTID